MIGKLSSIGIFIRFTQIYWGVIGFLLMVFLWYYLEWLGVLLSLLPLIYFIYANLQFFRRRGRFEMIPRNRAWVFFGGSVVGLLLKDLIISYLLTYLP
jgi:hypothetical protein